MKPIEFINLYNYNEISHKNNYKFLKENEGIIKDL